MLAALALASMLMAGCASPYVVVLTNGQRYTTAHKPALEQVNGRFNFVFVDSTGRTNSIPSGYVRAVVPASQLKPAQ
jgi:Tfp pilus assembly protein PilW